MCDERSTGELLDGTAKMRRGESQGENGERKRNTDSVDLQENDNEP